MRSLPYTSRDSFSEESLLHFPCCFQWDVLGTIVYNQAYMPDGSFIERQQTIDFVEFHVRRQKSYSTLILDTEKESKSLEKRDNGKVCPVRARHPLHTQLHTTSGLLVRLWQGIWAYRRAAATHTGDLASMGTAVDM